MNRRIRQIVQGGAKGRLSFRSPSLRTWTAISFTFSVFCLIPAILLLTPYLFFKVFNRILPNVQVGPVQVGWLSQASAAQKIDGYYNQGRMLQVTDGYQSWYLLPAQLGLTVDAEASARNALEIGHKAGFVNNYLNLINNLGTPYLVAPVVQMEDQKTISALQELNGKVRKEPTNATVALQNGALVPVAGQLGYAINLDETFRRIKANPAQMISSGSLTLALEPIPPPVTDASQALAAAEELISRAARLKAYDPVNDQWVELPVAREVVAGWISVASESPSTQLDLDVEKVKLYLSGLESQLGKNRILDAEKNVQAVIDNLEGRENAGLILVGQKPTTYLVEKGDTLLKIAWRTGFPIWKLLEANAGLNADKLLIGQVLNVPSKDELLPLPVIAGKRIVINIDKQRLSVFENGKQIKKFIISTGMDRSPTQPGIFQVQTHKANAYASVWDLYMPNFLGIYEAWPGFMNGIHGLPTLSNGTRLWANILGKPASFGCIILDLEASKFLFKWADNGVVVEITP